ncbi:MAG: GCN5-related N-acetyltransferase [Pseudonocardiales bacterium]|nr:GCN5-related N-acetyltransferase [Pseudonocardiales bacterium]
MGEWRGIELAAIRVDGPRLTLRRFEESDIDTVTRGMQDRRMHTFLPLPDPYTETDARSFTTKFAQSGRVDGTGFESALVERATGRVVGAAGLRLPGPRNVGAEIGYSVYSDGQGHGYATEASLLLSEWALAHDVARVYIRCAVENLASAKSALNAGFRFEGVERDGVLTPRGPEDAAVFSRLPGDSPERIGPPLPPLPAAGLSDDRLTLRIARRADAPARLRESSDSEVLRWSFTGRPVTAEEAARQVTLAELDWLVGRRGELSLVDEASGEVAGSMVLRLAGPPGIGGIGYNVLPQLRGRGYASRALRMLAEWALGPGGFSRLELGAKSGNIASQRTAINAGFVEDGVRAARLHNADGTFADEVRFARLR